jgi:hypothetical protein
MRCNALVAMTLVPLITMAGEPGTYQVDRGLQIPLSLVNDVSTANSIAGDAIFLRTSFPVASEGRMVIPPESWVTGTITEVKRARHGQRRGELHVRFDSLVLANGVSRKLHGDLGAHRVVGAESDKAAAARTVYLGATTGATVGPIAQIASGSFGYGGLIGGAVIGAAVGAVLVFSARGAEARIARGSVVVMTLDEPLTFSASELDFGRRRSAPE